MEWYYAVDGTRQGPVEESELRRLAQEGGLKPSDLVWNADMGDQWAEASTVPDLFDPAPVGASSGVTAEVAAAPVPVAGSVGPTPGRERVVSGVLSCTAAVGPAWERMRDILFRPFDIGKWFVLGVSAWLSTLGEGGGRVSFNGGDWSESFGGAGPDFDSATESIKDFFRDNAGTVALIAGIVVVVVLLGIVIGLVVMWLRSRGKFMLLDNVVHNRAEVADPWRTFAQHGNSLFKWSVGYALVCMGAFLLVCAVGFLTIALPCMNAQGFSLAAIPGIVLVSVLLLAFMIATLFIGRFLCDFIVPIMYQFDMTTTEAWRRFKEMMKGNMGPLVLYTLFYIVLSLAGIMAVGALMIVTCCIAFCLMAIPFVGAVVVLPVTVFFRAYSLEYLAQFGPEYDLLAGAEAEVVEA